MKNLTATLSSFTFAAFRLTIRALTPIRLPSYKGSALRGGFGHTFRNIVCTLKSADCDRCNLMRKCIYPYIFETPAPDEKDTFLKSNDKQPHPYIIRPPVEERLEYTPGEELTFELILIGKAIDYLAYFVFTFIQMGERGIGRGRGRFYLKSIHSTIALR